MNHSKMLINGAWRDASSKERFEIRSPYDRSLLGTAPKASKQDVLSAVDAARTAFDNGSWYAKLPSERAACLWKLADLVDLNAQMFAKLESQQGGKTIKYAQFSDLPFISDNLRFFAGASRMLEARAAAEYSGIGTSVIRREPVGVVAAIVPWNYPLYIAIWKLAPALAAGNTLVIKPASYTPLSLLEFGRFIEKVGIPKGVVNIITGSGEMIGSELAKSSKVDMIAVTGETSTGKEVMRNASVNLKKVHLELGGKAPMVVMPDADVEMAAQGAVVGGYWNAGQDCTAVTRVYVHEKMHDELVKRMILSTKKFVLGNPLDKNTDMGPLISEKQRERVESYVRYGLQQGAKLVCGGKQPRGKGFEKGYFFEPTIFTHVEQQMRICQEEIFGPVISVLSYKNLDEALAKANDVIFGLAASVYGKDITSALRMANKLRFGTVWINEHGILTSETPHGGFKQSGFGKDLSMYSFEEYTNLKHVYIDQTGLARKSWHWTVYGKQ